MTTQEQGSHIVSSEQYQIIRHEWLVVVFPQGVYYNCHKCFFHSTPPFSSASVQSRWYRSAQESPYALHPVDLRSVTPNDAFETVPIMLVWWTMALSQARFKVDHCSSAGFLHTSLCSRRTVVWCPWFCARKVVSQAPQHAGFWDLPRCIGLLVMVALPDPVFT